MPASLLTHSDIRFLSGLYSRNCRSATVRSRVNAKYPIWVSRQSFQAMSIRPRGSGLDSPSQIWKMFPPSTMGKNTCSMSILFESGIFAPGATCVPFV